jgi:aminoglycoside phosphotransferase family enzyme/predicted kinase
MPTAKDLEVTNRWLVDGLSEESSFDHPVSGPVEVHETHISWVFLAGDYAYKVKKPITNDFLDYGSLALRKRMCEEELRLDARYTEGLYLDVVPITVDEGQLQVNGSGVPVEYAIKMHRFPEDALLSHRLDQGTLTTDEVHQLATLVAEFHLDATRADHDMPWGAPELVFENMSDVIGDLRSVPIRLRDDRQAFAKQLQSLQHWSKEFFDDHRQLFQQRIHNGFIRECHGDLQLSNVFHWKDRLMPFDGIEFNEEFRWIDVLSDAAFLAMDFAARGHVDLSRLFMNAYLERTGDHASLALLRWYLVYRALVGAEVAAMRANQVEASSSDCSEAIADCRDHLDLGSRFSLPDERRLWITHGLSGSGKSTGSELVVARHGAIRLRSDIERKRHYGLPIGHRPNAAETEKIYSVEANDATYCRIRRLTRCILDAGFSVVVDATFLRQQDRELFRELADSCRVSFSILDFKADESTLRQRIADRDSSGTDVSDAGISVLEMQLKTQQPLAPEELQYVVEMPDPVAIVENS